MQFVVSKQIAVEAETPEDAVAKMVAGEGNTISFTVSPRPIPQVRTNPFPQGQVPPGFGRAQAQG